MYATTPTLSEIKEFAFQSQTRFQLGLIGNGISRSSAPRLHKIAGAMAGLEISYDLIDLEYQDPASFERVLEDCFNQGYWAVNVTYPFKERAAKMAQIDSPTVRQIGAVNTICFVGNFPGQGFNTDYSGFLRAYRHRFGGQLPGVVGIVGTGGVGRPVACGLAELGASELRLYDLALAKAHDVAETVRRAVPTVNIRVCNNLHELTDGVDGLVNCTPLGMWQYPGSPIPAELISHQRWAFDVIYTPLETEFLATARQKGLELLSGYELFFYQGVDAFEHFTRQCVDEEELRSALQQ